MAEVLINLFESAIMLINCGSPTLLCEVQKPTIFMIGPIRAKVPERSQLHEHDLPVISTAKVKTVTGRPLLPLPLVPQLREQCASWQRCCWGEQHRSGCQKQKKKKVIYYLFTLFPLKGFCHLWKSPEEKGKRFFFYLPGNIQHIIINYIANTLRQSPFEFFLSLNCTVLIYCLQEFFIYLFFPPLQPMKKRHI